MKIDSVSEIYINNLIVTAQLNIILYILFILQFADKQSVPFFCHDISIKSFKYHLFFLRGMDYAVTAIIQLNIIAYIRIILYVVR